MSANSKNEPIAPKAVFNKCLSRILDRFIDNKCGKDLASMSQVNRQWHQITQPRLYLKLEHSLSGTVIWCNLYAQPSKDVPDAIYRIMNFSGGRRSLFLLIDARPQNDQAVQLLHDTLLADDDVPNRNIDDDSGCCGGTVFSWLDSSGVSGIQHLAAAGRFTHGEALRKIKIAEKKYHWAYQVIIVNGGLDVSRLQALVNRENKYWKQNAKGTCCDEEDEDGDRRDYSCRDCNTRRPPGYFLISNIHHCLDRSQPLHKPGFTPLDWNATWLCIFYNYENNGTTGYMIDTRSANYAAIKLLHRFMPKSYCGDSYKMRYIPRYFRDEPDNCLECSEEGIHDDLLDKGVFLDDQPSLTIIRGEIDLEKVIEKFRNQMKCYDYRDINSIEILHDQDLPIKPGTELWPEQEEDVSTAFERFRNIEVINLRDDASSSK